MLAGCGEGLFLWAESDLVCTFDGSNGTAATLASDESLRMFSRRWLRELCKVEADTKSPGLELSLTGDITLLLQVLAPSSSLAARLFERRSRIPLPSVLPSRRECLLPSLAEEPSEAPVLMRSG